MEDFHKLLQKLDGEIRIVMEATGIYHLPVLTFLHDNGYFVSVVNPFAMKKYAKDNSIRGAKTDKLDSMMIANYGVLRRCLTVGMRLMAKTNLATLWRDFGTLI